MRLEPNPQPLPVGKKRCAMFFPVKTTDYRLVAMGENEMKTVEKIPTVTVLDRKPKQ